MKKNLIAVLLLLFLILYPPLVNAEENTTITDTPTPTQSVPILTPTIDYQLPYPGILPDSSMYMLKTIRDKIEGFLISNPLKKAYFDISKADSRMSAARSLVEQKKNISLAETTISKAENYYEEALNETREAKAQGMDTHDSVKRLKLASQKYEEIIIAIQKKIDKKDTKKLELVKERIKNLRKATEQIRS
jgi:hypothetical protein